MYISIATIKADAAQRGYATLGSGIVWAVVGTGIDASHPHFRRFQNLKLDPPLQHRDYAVFEELSDDVSERLALTDEHGHSTHEAGVIAGGLPAKLPPNMKLCVMEPRKDERDAVLLQSVQVHPSQISGIAPLCKIISLRVLDKEGRGPVSNVIAALEFVHEVNSGGRYIRIHGVHLGVSYESDVEFFACGQSPLCIEVNRLVQAGVVVVAAAGDNGSGWVETRRKDKVWAALPMTITDPGNAALAITVGSTHRAFPHMYGASYFSSKGPTADGRLKPDLLAPGERITSCAAGSALARLKPKPRRGSAAYVSASSTSAAAAHVSGAVAAFLSIHREFIGRPQEVKRIFLESATSLDREPMVQGHGLVDLMRALQSV